MHRHSTGMAGSGPHWSNPYFDGMGSVHGLILRRCCYSSQIIKIFVWLAVYFGLCSCRSNAFEETQNASTRMLDSITPIFLGIGMYWSFWGTHDSLQTIEILSLFAVYFRLFSCTSNVFKKTQNALTRMLDSITPIFSGYWHMQDRKAKRAAYFLNCKPLLLGNRHF